VELLKHTWEDTSGHAFAPPLGHAMAQVAEQLPKRSGRQWRIFGDDYVDQCIARHHRLGVCRRRLARRIQTSAAFAPGHPQQAAVVQAFEQLRGRVR